MINNNILLSQDNSWGDFVTTSGAITTNTTGPYRIYTEGWVPPDFGNPDTYVPLNFDRNIKNVEITCNGITIKMTMKRFEKIIKKCFGPDFVAQKLVDITREEK